MTAAAYYGLLVLVAAVAIGIAIMEVAPVIEGEDGDDLGWSTVAAIVVAVVVAVGLYVWVLG